MENLSIIHDAGMPSAESGLGSCPHCPAYAFSEKQHYLQLYHPKQSKQRKFAKKAKSVLSHFWNSWQSFWYYLPTLLAQKKYEVSKTTEGDSYTQDRD